MKENSSISGFVVVIDQVHSRSTFDRVPVLLERLDEVVGRAMTLSFERTAGDEVQGFTALPGAVVRAVVEATRLGDWRIGIGLGEVDTPLPSSTRAARGGAYLAAREAIQEAHRTPSGLRLVGPEVLGGGGIFSAGAYGDPIEMAESGLWLLRQLLARRSEQGWQIVDLLDSGMSANEAAAQLGISPSAVSQRQTRAHRLEAARGAGLCAQLLAQAQATRPALVEGSMA